MYLQCAMTSTKKLPNKGTDMWTTQGHKVGQGGGGVSN